MPIPTDTFWNIRRLNIFFAFSAILLLAITGWSVIQDWNKDWRNPQRAAKVWEAALTHDRIEKDLTEERRAEVERINQQIAEKEREILEEDQSYQALERDIKALESRKATTEFSLNSLKAELLVMEAQLQDALAAQQTQRVDTLRRQLAAPQQRVAEEAETLAQVNADLARLREDLKLKTAELEELRRQRTLLVGDVELLQNKLETLQPQRISARLSNEIRGAPLLQFMNPTERVRQVVLDEVEADMVYMKVKQIDRCMTCHVNIADKTFTEERVLAYLEEQTGVVRQLNLPRTQARPTDPSATAAAPGAVAMLDFWHQWAVTLAPDVVAARTRPMRLLLNTVGKVATVTVDGQTLESFTYDPALNTAAPATQPAAAG